tara:strand:- start:9057 stop:9389 length:333 start_codon:yes stop_codon:yes gene_type:complete
MTTYTHKCSIAALPRQNVGGDQEVITEIHVAITTTDGAVELTQQAFAYTIPETAVAGPYIAIADLDIDTILGWIPSDLMAAWKASMETQVDAKALSEVAAARTDVPAYLV